MQHLPHTGLFLLWKVALQIRIQGRLKIRPCIATICKMQQVCFYDNNSTKQLNKENINTIYLIKKPEHIFDVQAFDIWLPDLGSNQGPAD